MISYGHEMVMPPGVEPGTYALEGRCSIQLSYGTNKNNFKKPGTILGLSSNSQILSNLYAPIISSLFSLSKLADRTLRRTFPLFFLIFVTACFHEINKTIHRFIYTEAFRACSRQYHVSSIFLGLSWDWLNFRYLNLKKRIFEYDLMIIGTS